MARQSKSVVKASKKLTYDMVTKGNHSHNNLFEVDAICALFCLTSVRELNEWTQSLCIVFKDDQKP